MYLAVNISCNALFGYITNHIHCYTSRYKPEAETIKFVTTIQSVATEGGK